MSFAVVHTRGLAGLEAPLVRVEAHLGSGLPCFQIVGLPDTEVKEARERVRAAFHTARFPWPDSRITVNLAPADLPKESGRFDLPIAIGILAAQRVVPRKALAGLEFAGELGLSGELRPIRGALAMTLGALRDGRAFVVPESVAAEAALARGARVLPARTLQQVCDHLNGLAPIAPQATVSRIAPAGCADLADVRGQAAARRALEVAAAGGHSLLFYGPPGTGKTLLASRLPGVLPDMAEQEALEAAAVQSLAAGAFAPERYGVRAFRSPHHTASAVALVGGGSPPRPGEISLAHHGVLFLDELPEFSRHVLEVLREPLESGRITISRAGSQADFPARFQLVAAMNPCPCGYLGEDRCKCNEDQVRRYRARISGPLLDRIDLHVEVPRLPSAEMDQAPPGEPSSAVRQRVVLARERQLGRQGCANSALTGALLESFVRIDPAGRALLRMAAERMRLSMRAHQRVLRVARTLADLEGSPEVSGDHLGEAIRYRGG